MKQIDRYSFPIKLDWGITGKCNLRCAHCGSADTWQANEFSTAECKELLDYLHKEGLWNLFLYGGEPFVRPDIVEILDHLNSLPIAWTTSTNGTLLDDKLIKVLKKMRYVKMIQVSIDGSCPEVHDRQRGDGVFVKAERGFKLLREAGIPTCIRMSLTRLNLHDIEGMILFAKKHGMRSLGIGDVVKSGAACENDKNIGLSIEEYKKTFIEIDRLQKKYPDMNLNGSVVQVLDMIKKYYSSPPGSGSRGTFGTCGAGREVLGLRSDGMVVPCSGWWTYPVGDIRKQSLREIWNNSESLNKVRALENKSLEEFEECRQCGFMTFCNGGCRSSAYHTSGGIDGRYSLLCDIFSRGEKIVELMPA